MTKSGGRSRKHVCTLKHAEAIKRRGIRKEYYLETRGDVLLRNLDEAAWTRRGTANGKEVSVRALAYTIAGHELHHRQILEEKYFAAR